MKAFLITVLFGFSQLVFANPPPENYPLVNGVVRKIDLAGSRISIKHEAIPNLNMPGMTMSFLAFDPQMLQGLDVGDQIHFVADEIDGELSVLWIEKVEAPNVDANMILCRGVADTTPKTKIEVEVRKDKFSTIRYEFAEGSLKGTAYINSIGRMELQKLGDLFLYSAGPGKLDSQLQFKVQNDQIRDAQFTLWSAGMDKAPVQCQFEK